MPQATGGAALALALQRDIEADCRRALLSAFRELDEFADARLTARFTPDAIWHREGREFAGQGQILAALEQRPRNQVVRHLITNLLVGVESPTRAAASGYNTVFRALGASAADVPVAIAAPLGLWVLEATLVRSGDTWLIAHLRQTQQFSFICHNVPCASTLCRTKVEMSAFHQVQMSAFGFSRSGHGSGVSDDEHQGVGPAGGLATRS